LKRIALAAAAALAILPSAPASAARIVYTFAGTFSGTADGRTFTGQEVVFNAVGDTATARTGADDVTMVDVSTMTASMGGVVVFSLAEPTIFGFDATNGNGGILDRMLGRQYSAFGAPALAGYDAVSSFAGVVTNLTIGTNGGPFASSNGPSTITDITNLRFSAVVAANDAVPEPATWGLMLAGFALVGTGLRVRRRSTADA
jgi:hypothetical protein